MALSIFLSHLRSAAWAIDSHDVSNQSWLTLFYVSWSVFVHGFILGRLVLDCSMQKQNRQR